MLWIGFWATSGLCAYTWYWYIRSFIFYFRSGFDFSEDFGPQVSWSEFQDDERDLANPREKFLVARPVSVLATSFILVCIVLALMEWPCVGCGP
ncbi:hypothetical protein NE852_14150 [Rhizobium sp. Pop5]|nr:hypothetical protein [Rhizobium sp. Pop5]UVD59153.1 hypothetical protein NE852_14150 [Rhizobium sp. Pop5]